MDPKALLESPYPSGRQPVIGTRGAVATSQPLAAGVGLEVLRAGGTAVDAAVATAAALSVVEPTSNGIGGDAFALVWDGVRLHGLNGSGRAPTAMTRELFAERGLSSIPATGWLPVTVPGAPAAWRDLHARFGRLPFERVLEGAVRLAADGFPVSPVVAASWSRAASLYAARLNGPEFRGWFDTFAPAGRGPGPAEVVRLPDHARTLDLIARTSASSFYEGELAARTEAFAARTGGLLTAADLRAHSSTWVEPISTSYRGLDVWEIPPSGQGIATLTALNVLEGFELARLARETSEAYHLQIEAMKLGFADALAHVADPERASVPVAMLLDKGYAATRRALVGETALEPTTGIPPRGGTVYLCAADAEGMMVSFIQSNYRGFGSGVVVPGTGIALQNRGENFSLDPGSPNRLEPGKRPYHTIIPGFLTRGRDAVGPFGVMGGFMQPQGHLQVIANTLDFGLNPQAALDAPRWQWLRGRRVELERGVAAPVVDGLRRRGHDVTIGVDPGAFGRGQIIWRVGEALVAASEPRADGQALVY